MAEHARFGRTREGHKVHSLDAWHCPRQNNFILGDPQLRAGHFVALAPIFDHSPRHTWNTIFACHR